MKLSHELDPTRPAAVGGAQREGFDKLGDVAGYNGDGARLYINPGFPNLVTEYGSCTADRPGDLRSLLGRSSDPAIPLRSGQAIWAGFQHSSNCGLSMGKMGIIDYFRLPLRAWYWYRNAYLKIPPPEWPKPGVPAKLQLQADRTTLAAPDGTDDCHLIVTVLDAAGRHVSNSPPVTLNVESGPGEFPLARPSRSRAIPKFLSSKGKLPSSFAPITPARRCFAPVRRV